VIVYDFEKEATDQKEVKTFEGLEDRQQTPRPWLSLYMETSLPGLDPFTHLLVEIHDVFFFASGLCPVRAEPEGYIAVNDPWKTDNNCFSI
jgi:hypothetical protein